MVPYNDPIIGGESCMLYSSPLPACLGLPVRHPSNAQSGSSVFCQDRAVFWFRRHRYGNVAPLSLSTPTGHSFTLSQLPTHPIIARVALTVSRPPALYSPEPVPYLCLGDTAKGDGCWLGGKRVSTVHGWQGLP